MSATPVKSIKTAPAPLNKRIWTAITSVTLSCVCLGVGFSVGWTAKTALYKRQQLTTTITPPIAPKPLPTPTPTSTVSPTYEPSPTAKTSPTSVPILSRPPRVVLIGDSITDVASAKGGFSDLLQSAYGDSVEVLNHGRSGYNTEWTLRSTLPDIADKIQATPAPVLITVWLGNNDAALVGGHYQAKHVPIDKFKQNLVTILVTVRRLAPSAKLVLITPSVIDNDTRKALLISRGQVFDPLDRSNEQAGLYAAATREITTITAGIDVSLVDIYQYFMVTYPNATDRATVLEDGLHYSLKGHRDVFEQLSSQFQHLVPTVLNNTAV